MGELKAKEENRDGLNEFAEEIANAVAALKSLEWEDIRVERFNMTPPALFTEMVRTAESLLHRQAAETVEGNFPLSLSDCPRSFETNNDHEDDSASRVVGGCRARRSTGTSTRANAGVCGRQVRDQFGWVPQAD